VSPLPDTDLDGDGSLGHLLPTKRRAGTVAAAIALTEFAHKPTTAEKSPDVAGTAPQLQAVVDGAA
jgi:hypothetical protein